MDVHPLGNDPGAPLFVTQYKKREKTRLSYEGLRGVCKINKKYFPQRLRRLYPYVFRHSRATHLASFMTEAQLCQHFGWVQGSKMPRVYIHLSGRDVDEAVLRAYGLKPVEKEEGEAARRCPICKELNPPGKSVCWKCQRPFEVPVNSMLMAFYWENERDFRDVVKEVLREILDEERALEETWGPLTKARHFRTNIGNYDKRGLVVDDNEGNTIGVIRFWMDDEEIIIEDLRVLLDRKDSNFDSVLESLYTLIANYSHFHGKNKISALVHESEVKTLGRRRV